MKRYTFLFFFLFIISAEICKGQTQIRGYLLDSVSLHPVINASILVKSDNLFTITDSTGYFSINVNRFPETIQISHVAYNQFEYVFKQAPKSAFTIYLSTKDEQLETVVFVYNREKENEQPLKKIDWGISEIQKLSSGIGGIDIIRSLQTQPGIQKSSEINASLNVRGSGHGSNKISLNGITIFNSYHLLGIAPMFNSDVINNITLYKSGYPIDKDGYLSSFLDVELRKPSIDEKNIRFEIGNLTTKFLYEGPLVKDKVSVLFTTRYAFFDLYGNIYKKINEKKEDFVPLPKYKFYDGNFIVNAKLPKNYNLFFSFFSNSDNFLYSPSTLDLKCKWTNNLGSVSISKMFSDNIFFRLNSGITQYSFDGEYNPSSIINRKNNITGIENQVYISYKTIYKVDIKAGVFFNSGKYYLKNEEKYSYYSLRQASFNVNSYCLGVFADADWKLSNHFSLLGGGRLNFYYPWRKKVYSSPRIQLTYKGKPAGINISFDQTWQFNNLIAPLGFNIPADLWLPADKDIPPQQARQIALHLTRNFKFFETYLGVFYKEMKNQAELKDGAEIIEIAPSQEITYGTGEAYGMEASLIYRKPLLDIELYYTYSKSVRKFEEINNGKNFAPVYDVPHKLDILVSVNITKNISSGVSWFWSSGPITTMPTGYIFINHGSETNPYPVYTERNNFRMPDTHRLDVSVTFSKTHRWGDSRFTLGLYNVYNQTNAYFMYFKLKENEQEETSVVPQQLGIFPLVPFFSYMVNFKL